MLSFIIDEHRFICRTVAVCIVLPLPPSDQFVSTSFTAVNLPLPSSNKRRESFWKSCALHLMSLLLLLVLLLLLLLPLLQLYDSWVDTPDALCALWWTMELLLCSLVPFVSRYLSSHHVHDGFAGLSPNISMLSLPLGHDGGL